LAVVFTVSIISYAYGRIIEHFPTGGGGYVVATELLGKNAGVVSGCALIIDYILTITISIAAGGDALFSLLPASVHHWKLPLEYAAIAYLLVMNLRGVKESVTPLIPIFITFVISHIALILMGIFTHIPQAEHVVQTTQVGLHSGLTELGWWGLFLIFINAYSLGGGTYTGIEAVSNGVGILREPKVQTGKKTMKYMALSLGFTAGGLLLCYMLMNVQPVEGQTLNAVLSESLFKNKILVYITMISEAVLLFVAAQTGFIDGPRVMANMAQDSWLPRRFAALSDRLAMQNGILLFGMAALAMLAYTGGHVGILVIMYSVNVFLTFSLSEAGMVGFWYRNRKKEPTWKKDILVHGTGLVLCSLILVMMIAKKFMHGAWVTAVITGICIFLCFIIRRHYYSVAKKIRDLDKVFSDLPITEEKAPVFDPQKPTAVILVGGYSGLGKHIFLNIFRHFRDTFKNVLFITVGVATSDFFKGHHVGTLKTKTEESLANYVLFSAKMGVPASYEYKMGAEVVETASELCVEVAQKYPRAVFFAGELVFEEPKWYHRVLHNETAYAILRRIRFAGLPMVILPIRIRENAK
jgi:amino acid transporter